MINDRSVLGKLPRVAVLLATLPITACMATVGASGVVVPRDSAQTCAGLCESIGMRLSAVAIMANNVGCVCEPPAAAPAPAHTSAAGSSTASAGMATILMQQSAAEQNQRRQ